MLMKKVNLLNTLDCPILRAKRSKSKLLIQRAKRRQATGARINFIQDRVAVACNAVLLTSVKTCQRYSVASVHHRQSSKVSKR